jgi:hypothetical protein
MDSSVATAVDSGVGRKKGRDGWERGWQLGGEGAAELLQLLR